MSKVWNDCKICCKSINFYFLHNLLAVFHSFKSTQPVLQPQWHKSTFTKQSKSEVSSRYPWRKTNSTTTAKLSMRTSRLHTWLVSCLDEPLLSLCVGDGDVIFSRLDVMLLWKLQSQVSLQEHPSDLWSCSPTVSTAEKGHITKVKLIQKRTVAAKRTWNTTLTAESFTHCLSD